MYDLKEQLAMLDEKIDALPRGSISTKKVNGHTYSYHRWYEGKTKRERFIPEDKLEQLRALENGMKIYVLTSNLSSIGVDTPEDLVKAEAKIRESMR